MDSTTNINPLSTDPDARRLPKMLYLGFAFPPGIQKLYPGVNPAGHGFEMQMVRALRTHFEIRSVGVLPMEVPPSPADADPASGLRHDLVLLEKAPELVHRYRSLAQLKRQYRRWQAEGWVPSAVLAYNLSPIYNNFVRWLRRQTPRPRLALLLLDSSHLGKTLPALKRLRYQFKPLVIADAEMIESFDACIGLSQSAEQFFAPRQVPFLWMPGGCTPQRADSIREVEAESDNGRPIRFGYFGALAEHAGVKPLAETFLGTSLSNELHICGYGKLSETLKEFGNRDARLKFGGLLPTPEDCLRFAQSCDVLINPRPFSHGNENNFPSKVFEYALCGRAILTSRLAGVDAVLGPEAFYFDPHDFTAGLRGQLEALARTPRGELRRRGIALRERITSRYSWPQQTAAMAEFIARLS